MSSFHILKDIVSEQKTYFKSGVSIPVTHRIELLKKLKSALLNRESKILEALYQDLGKPKIEAYLSEVLFLSQEIDLICKKLSSWLKPKKVGNPFYFMPAKSWYQLEPYGCTLILSPWNYPIQLSLSPLIGAVAAGNTVVLKPSELTPHAEALIEEIVKEVFDKRHVTVVTGGIEVSQALLKETWDFIFFTGSTHVGKVVAEAAATHLTPTALELGGKCPCIVGEETNIPETASRILTGKFFNAGQTCFAPDFVAVHSSIKEELVSELHTQLKARYCDEPIKDIGKIINTSQYERLLNLRLTDDYIVGEDDKNILHMAPTISHEATWDSPCMQEEVFGPILPIVSYENDDTLLSLVNKYSSPLALYIFSSNKEWTEKISSSIPSGGVCTNDTMKQSSNLYLPFGGVGASGSGRYRGEHSVKCFSYERAYTRRYFLKDTFALTPPYKGVFEKMRKFMKP